MFFPFELFVALRYLLARRKQTLISIVSVISVLGVAAGVAALVVALALNSGFQKEFQDRILGATSHVSLYRLGNIAISNYATLTSQLGQIPGVTAVAATTYEQAILQSDLNRQQPVILRGVDPEGQAILGDLFGKIIEGDPTHFSQTEPEPSLLVGKDLAEALGILVGDRVKAVGASGELSPFGILPRFKTFKVIAIFESGLWEYDANWALVPLSSAQKFVGLDADEVSALEFRIEDIYAADEVAKAILDKAGLGFTTRTWIELNRPLFSALKLEKLALFIAIGLIVMVASLNIVSTLTLMVMEKNRDIAIISAMGGRARTIMSIFMLEGLIIGLIGTLLGAAFGSLAAWYLNAYQVFQLEPQVYSIPYVPFQLAAWDVAVVSCVAILISFLATLYPAWTASRVDPIEGLRYE